MGLPGSASGAAPLDLDDLTGDLEAGTASEPDDRRFELGIDELGHRTTLPTQQETGAMRRLGADAAHEGVAAVDPVNEPLAHQEVEGPIDGRRRHAPTLGGKTLEDVVSADRGVAIEDELEDAPAQLGQPDTPLGADRGRPIQRVAHAEGVIVSGPRERIARLARHFGTPQLVGS